MKKIKKRYKLKKRVIIIPIIIIVLILSKNTLYKIYISSTSEYQKETIETFFEEDIYSSIKNESYSKTLDKIINTKYYNQKYLNEYLNIDYIEKDNFLENINNLLTHGYNSSDINTIYNKLDDNEINILLNNEYIKDITNIINLSYFKEENLERYLKYSLTSTEDSETIVTYVNIGLDNEYYTNIETVDNQDDILVLVNKYNSLSSDYIPKDLENINSKYGSGKLRKEAKEAFESMCENAKKENIYIYSGSAYRSYEYQKNLYNRYVAKDGKKLADTYSARAGHSEHQTGLAIDILGKSWDYIDKDDIEYSWLISNAHKYGFILRYPKDKEKITGYMYEEWHFRYIGIETATEVYNLNITYDEYIEKK